jgi:hypothetical protein
MNMKVVLLVALTLVFLGVPASFARPEYVSSLNAEYGVSSPNHRADPNAALIAIGAPPNANPTVTATATMTPAATNLTNNITDVTETNENETNATEIAIEEGNATVVPVDTTVEPASPVETTIEPTIPVSTTKPSPGFGIVMTIGMVLSIIYLFGKRR